MAEDDASKEVGAEAISILKKIEAASENITKVWTISVDIAHKNAVAQESIADALQRIARCYERQMRVTQDPDTYSGPSRGFKPPIGGPPPNLGG